MEELEATRALLKELEKLLPALLSRCQQVDKMRKQLLRGGVNGVDTAKARLEEVESERNNLRRYVTDKLDGCGNHQVLHDVRVLVRACETLDDKLMEWPVAKAVPNVIRTFATRRRQLLQDIKLCRSRSGITGATSRGSVADATPRDSFLESDRGQREILARHLARLSRVLKSIDECNGHLRNVRAEAYVERFEDTRASLQNEKDGVKSRVADWSQRHREAKSDAWVDHGDLVCTLMSALEIELDSKLVAAIREDIDVFTKEYLPPAAAALATGRQAPVLRKVATRRSVAKKKNVKKKQHGTGAKSDERVELDFQILGAGLS